MGIYSQKIQKKRKNGKKIPFRHTFVILCWPEYEQEISVALSLDVAEDRLEGRLLRAVRRILRPLIRIMLRNGISATTFQELARKEFVDVAHEDFGIPGRKQTVSRVSVLTGLSRKEVRRLQQLPPVDTLDQTWRNRAATVLSGWAVDPEFCDSKGDPVDLSFDQGTPNFVDLVKKYSGDMQPRAIADELIRNGALVVVDDKYRMQRRGYVPLDDPSAMIDMLGTDSAELIETIDHNIQSQDDKLLQAKVLAENLPQEHVEEFVTYSKRLARHTLDELTHWLVERDKGEEVGVAEGRFEVGLGLYHIVREVREANESPPVSGEQTDQPREHSTKEKLS